MDTKRREAEASIKDAKKVFRKLGTCSQTYFYLLNRAFGENKRSEERAADPLAGGIMKAGYQCGMLWGASLAVGAEAYRRCEHLSQAIRVAVEATRELMDSFETHESTTQCREITRCDFNNNLSFAKYMLSGRFLHCFRLAQEWAPIAVENAQKSLDGKPFDFQFAQSCATEVAQKMSASKEEMVMVAGFAGGLGLSGSACGALAATIWMNALDWCKKHEAGSPSEDPRAQEIMRSFRVFTDDMMLCKEISQRDFRSVEDHTQYLKNGGCFELIEELSHI
ncbi:C-GCAxxG-C-C family protein [Lutimonas zeaxanthinifaciens]|uniref:C-GCAxxG-C-C family protein n=1 Tax=Lutimonas zeaxanthinifaciens TaxID=3060215 RepID=UPI00265D05AE|nr:C-GCAxxG-C-C family protein [Lutimonas sp. YSD2104]WKK67012.1 C-GCAxxG-C-C family protein [Lutimonas sp. YSD2104]